MPKKKQIEEITDTNNNRADGKKYTNMFVTINTNKTDQQLLPAFRTACSNAFNNLEHYINFLTPSHSLNHIDDINCQYRIEIGPTNHTLHVHALIKIAHHSYIRVQIRELKEDIRRAMGITEDFHQDVKYLKASEGEQNLLQYMQKK